MVKQGIKLNTWEGGHRAHIYGILKNFHRIRHVDGLGASENLRSEFLFGGNYMITKNGGGERAKENVL